MLYAILQIVGSVFASDGLGVSTQRVIFLTYEAIFGLLLTHIFRNLISKWGWLDTGMSRLIPRIIFSVIIIGLILYLIKIPISIPLGLFNSKKAFDVLNAAVLTMINAFIFFLWCVLYFCTCFNSDFHRQNPLT